MAKQEIILPAMGEGIIEATLIKWLKSEGDTVEEDEPIVEIATDKVDSEVPSPANGALSKIIVAEGEIVKVGAVIAIIENDQDNSTDVEAEKQAEKIAEEIISDTELISVSEKSESGSETILEHKTPGGRFLSPLVRKIAAEHNLSGEFLDLIEGTGLNQRLTKEDILNAIAQFDKTETHVSADLTQKASEPAKPTVIADDQSFEIIEMDRMRRLIADHMVNSVKTSPHVTSFMEADVTSMVQWRGKVKDLFSSRENTKLTFTPLFIEAVVKALKDFPLINSSVDGYKIIRKKNINIGLATALPNGNLIVPVIPNADQMNLIGLAKMVNDLAERARTNKLLPAEIQGSTFTITNFGSFNNLSGTPIINQPEVAILGIGTIKKKPVVIETEMGDTIAIRHMLMLSLSYDHRIVDGAMGGSFLNAICKYLEAFDKNRTF